MGAAGAEIRQTRDAELVPFGIRSACLLNAIQTVIRSLVWKWAIRFATTRAISSGVYSGKTGKIRAPVSSCCPIMRGRRPPAGVERALFCSPSSDAFFDDEDFLETICEFAEQTSSAGHGIPIFNIVIPRQRPSDHLIQALPRPDGHPFKLLLAMISKRGFGLLWVMRLIPFARAKPTAEAGILQI